MAAHIRALSLWRRVTFTKLSGGVRSCSTPSGTQVHEHFTSKTVRRMFIDFFKEKHQHRAVPSSPVRPRGDPSLLFVNAGMNQFKPILLGCADPRSEMASYRRAVNSQKCVRAGGKHNDLEDVGRDVYHHTFFEMLGNWSFGDYFKVEACAMAWHLLTEVYRIPAERLYVSYFSGDAANGLPADEETRQIWLSLGVSPDHVLPFGMMDNFWEMGETGPCGPCTEIHYDHVGSRHAGALINTGSPAVVEIWNLVFMQYSREADGGLRPLPMCSVDTGMGLERLVTVLQGKRSNYDTDLFTPLLSAIHQCSKAPTYRGRTGEEDDGRVDMGYRVVADHIRTLCVCIADGVHPGMTGAELVLRRILRRAVRFSTEVLQAPEGALASLVTCSFLLLLFFSLSLQIVEIININETQFLASLRQGRRVIDRTLSKMDRDDEFPAPVAWALHHNLGFPLDLIYLMLEERSATLDRLGLERLAARYFHAAPKRGLHLDLQCLAELQSRGVPHTDDSFKYSYSLQQDGTYMFPGCSATVMALYCNQSLLSEVGRGQRCGMVLDRTCFYAEQGGQTHDQGYFTKDGLQDVLFPVECARLAGGYVVHELTATETLRTGDQIQLHVDETRRVACMEKHTAAHMLNFALRELLGSGVAQRGSHVTADRLRFDFSSKSSLSVSQLQEVERLIQRIIKENHVVHTQEVPLARANEIAGLRTVDEVYPDPVRVVSVGLPVSELLHDHTPRRVSVELCCGTHLLRTGGIRHLVITSERQMVKGISRIVAVTGDDAKQVGSGRFYCLRELQTGLKALQRRTNTTIRKLEIREAAAKAHELLKRHLNKTVLVDTLETDSKSVTLFFFSPLSSEEPERKLSVSRLPFLSYVSLHMCSHSCLLQGQTAVSASEWALAVCGRLRGSAGGSATVAKGVGTATDVAHLQETLRWAEEFAHSKRQHALHTQ
uniref:Alanine--tRNA ligase n=1 Tax=Electrophorus electricus TaxID=8005 RepID=A0A4W4HSH6_ELEEL